MPGIDYTQKIPNNVDLKSDKRLQRALESWQPKYLDWWASMGPTDFNENEVYLRTAVGVDAKGWAHYEMVKMPAAKFDYDLSPMQVVVSQKSKEVYHFLTSLCAIVGGVFTVAGIFDSGFYQASRVLKKEKMGKLG